MPTTQARRTVAMTSTSSQEAACLVGIIAEFEECVYISAASGCFCIRYYVFLSRNKVSAASGVHAVSQAETTAELRRQ